MGEGQAVFVLCSGETDVSSLVSALTAERVEVVVARKLSEAIGKLRELPYDVAIVEPALDHGASGLKFLAEARRLLPAMLRVVLETRPLEAPLRDVINDVAPSAIISGADEAAKVLELLAIKRQSGRIVTRVEEESMAAELSDLLDTLMQEPEIGLPVLPEIARQVERLLRDERTTFPKIAEWVEREQSMAARILQVANSPIYATRERIHSLEQAVARLGLRETRHLLEAVIAENVFRTDNDDLVHMMRELWLHSVCTAYCNERIARTLGIPGSEDYFIMGLFHDVGKLLILHLIESARKRSMIGEPKLSESVLKKLIVKRHNDLGERLVRDWSYPSVFQTVIRRHNDARRLEPRAGPLSVTCVSNSVTHQLGYGFAPGKGHLASEGEIAEVLGVSLGALHELQDSLVETLERIKHSCFAEFRGKSVSRDPAPPAD